MIETSAKINAETLQEGLHAKSFGRKMFFSREVDSTNDWAKKLAKLDASEGTVIIAETQTHGRGRLGREWISPKGGLWFSVILRPKLYASEAVRLVFVAGLAVAEVLRELYCLRVETKWPNDILVNGRKVCGILMEMKTKGETIYSVILGVGINANFNAEKAFPEELRANATSLENELDRKISLEELFRILLERLENLYELFSREGFGSILKRWKSYAAFLGCQVDVSSATEKWIGLALDVDTEGALILKLKNGTEKRVFVGDVSLRSR